MENNIYDHYIAIDWSIACMAIARMTKKSHKITVLEQPADLSNLQAYLKNLEGKKILAIEETTTSQWLYTELKNYVDKILVCDPYRNRLLSEGPKTDKIDASKLVQLLKAGLMKEVYHSSDKFLYLRRLVSGYDDLVKALVRMKNQRYGLLRACGKTGEEKTGATLEVPHDQFVLVALEEQIKSLSEAKKKYEKQFEALAKAYPEIRHQRSLPGIGPINSVKIVSRVVTPYRFVNKGHYLSYAGLVKLDRLSGGRSYGRKSSRHCRELKSVYKTAALIAIERDSSMKNFYEHLIQEKNYTTYNARNKICRHLAVLSWGVFKSGKSYQSDWKINPAGKRQELSSGL